MTKEKFAVLLNPELLKCKMKLLKKKGMVLWEMVVFSAVVLVIGFVLLKIIIPSLTKTENPISYIQLEAKIKACNSKELLGEVKEPIEEGSDKDGISDDCDICLGGDNKEYGSNSNLIPDECYTDPLKNDKIKTYKDMCLYHKGSCYIEETGQCCLVTYAKPNKCGTKCKTS